MQQNCHSDNFLDQLRAFPPPFGQSPSGLPITQDFCLEKLIRNNGPFLDTSFHEKIFLILFMKRVTVRTFSKGMKQNRHEFFTLWAFLRYSSRNFQLKSISFTLSFCREIDSQPVRLKTYILVYQPFENLSDRQIEKATRTSGVRIKKISRSTQSVRWTTSLRVHNEAILLSRRSVRHLHHQTYKQWGIFHAQRGTHSSHVCHH